MSIELQFHDRIRSYNLSPEGENWVKRALYPPGSNTKLSMPSGDPQATLRTDYKPALSIGAPDSGGTWDCLLLQLPGDHTAFYWVAARNPNGPADFTAFDAPAGYVYKCGVVSNAASDADDVLRAVAYTGAAVPQTKNEVTIYGKSSMIRSAAFRHTYRGFTAHMTSSELYDGGNVTAAQYPVSAVPTGLYQEFSVGPSVRCYAQATGTLYLSEDQLTRGVPDAHIAPARDGVFIPTRIGSSTFTPSTLPIGLRTLNNAMWTIPIDPVNRAAGINTVLLNRTESDFWPFWLRNICAQGPHPVLDSAYNDSNAGVAIFRGLHPNATIAVQAWMGNEYVLDQTSPFLTMTQLPAPADERAVFVYRHLAASLARAYPARANSLGTALALAAKALRFIAPHALAGAKALAPVVASAFRRPSDSAGPTSGARNETKRFRGATPAPKRRKKAIVFTPARKKPKKRAQ